MRYRVEYFPNPACASVHIDHELTRRVIELWGGPESEVESQSPMVKDMFAIPGVTGVHLKRYEVGLEKGVAFTWNEIIFKAKGVILTHLDPTGELVEIGSPIFPEPPSEKERMEIEMDGLLP